MSLSEVEVSTVTLEEPGKVAMSHYAYRRRNETHRDLMLCAQ